MDKPCCVENPNPSRKYQKELALDIIKYLKRMKKLNDLKGSNL
jgi:hypothetical protein